MTGRHDGPSRCLNNPASWTTSWDLRNRLLQAVARRNAQERGTPPWRATEQEIAALTRQIWLREPIGENRPALGETDQAEAQG